MFDRFIHDGNRRRISFYIFLNNIVREFQIYIPDGHRNPFHGIWFKIQKYVLRNRITVLLLLNIQISPITNECTNKTILN